MEGRVREGKRERLRERDFYWFTTQMVSAAEPALDQSQVPGTVSVQFHPLDGREPSTWTTFLCFYRCISREVEQLGPKLYSNEMTHHSCAVALAPVAVFQ